MPRLSQRFAESCLKRRLVSEFANILARVEVEEAAKAFDDSDLYYARALARSDAGEYVKRMKPSPNASTKSR